MSYAIDIAVVAGLIAGVISSVWLAVRIYRYASVHIKKWSHRQIFVLKLVTAVVFVAAIFPSAYLGFFVGGNFGGMVGAHGGLIGIQKVTIPMGIGLGIGIVFAVCESFATVIGLLLGSGLAFACGLVNWA